MVTVVLAPYLQVRGRLRLGRWEIIPGDELERADCYTDLAFEQARGLLALYRKPKRVRAGFGCFIRRTPGLVGVRPQAKEIPILRRALLAGLLDANPDRLATAEEDPNVGHRVWTSDHLDVVGHDIKPEGYVSATYGAMSTTHVIGLQIGQEHSEIAPPTEVPFPIMGRPPDPIYCDALWDVLCRETVQARRLAGAIDWLDAAWRNTISTTMAMRIVMLKCGFEVLLGVGDKIDPQRTALSALLDPKNAPRRTRNFVDGKGNPKQKIMTGLEWWFTKFTFLRNAITHGDQTTNRDFRHGRAWHMWIGEYRLRQAIKETVALHGHPLVRLDEFQRGLQHAVQLLTANLPQR